MTSETVISNDSTGVFGTARNFEKVWGFLRQEKKPLKIEAVGWKWLSLLIPGYKKAGITVKGVHGKTGGIHDAYDTFDRIKLSALNRILLPNTKLINLNSSIEYILFHSPQIKRLQEAHLLHKLKGEIKTVFIENHLHIGALGSAKENVINLRHLGINAGLMIDYGHVLNTEFGHDVPFNITFDWGVQSVTRVIRELKDYDPQIPIAFHLPIGESDCLQMEKMKNKHWRRIAEIHRMVPDGFVVIENQQEFSNSFILTPKMERAQKERNMMNVDMLVNNRVIYL